MMIIMLRSVVFRHVGSLVMRFFRAVSLGQNHKLPAKHRRKDEYVTQVSFSCAFLGSILPL